MAEARNVKTMVVTKKSMKKIATADSHIQSQEFYEKALEVYKLNNKKKEITNEYKEKSASVRSEFFDIADNIAGKSNSFEMEFPEEGFKLCKTAKADTVTMDAEKLIENSKEWCEENNTKLPKELFIMQPVINESVYNDLLRFAERVEAGLEKETKRYIPSEVLRSCVSATHSTPSFEPKKMKKADIEKAIKQDNE